MTKLSGLDVNLIVPLHALLQQRSAVEEFTCVVRRSHPVIRQRLTI